MCFEQWADSVLPNINVRNWRISLILCLHWTRLRAFLSIKLLCSVTAVADQMLVHVDMHTAVNNYHYIFQRLPLFHLPSHLIDNGVLFMNVMILIMLQFFYELKNPFWLTFEIFFCQPSLQISTQQSSSLSLELSRSILKNINLVA